MRLRIAKKTSRTRVVVLQVDGELAREGVAELKRVCASITGRMRVDLSNLRSADDAGLATIRDLESAGAEVVGASPYIRLLLAVRTPDAPSGTTEASSTPKPK